MDNEINGIALPLMSGEMCTSKLQMKLGHALQLVSAVKMRLGTFITALGARTSISG